MQSIIYHIHALSALHSGSGQGIGAIDLPIARAKATNLPIVPGSSLKGVLRNAKKQLNIDKQKANSLFGAEFKGEVAESSAGSVAIGDAQLLILPVRSFAGVVAYATCPFILRRYQRDIANELDIPIPEGLQALVIEEVEREKVKCDLIIPIEQSVVLEDIDLKSNSCKKVTEWANHLASTLYPESTLNCLDWRKEFIQRFVILPDEVFSFLVDTATEIRTRNRINPITHVVENGNLWTEENLPAESVLWGVLGVDESRNNDGIANDLVNKNLNIQIGGKHTVGRGLCRFLTADKQVEKTS